MRRRLTILFFLLSIPLLAATGDPKWVVIETNGIIADVCFTAMATGGTYSIGLGTSNMISGNEKLVINFNSPGYDTSGTSVSVPRTTYGTFPKRKAFNSQSAADENLTGSDVVCRFALSRTVHSGDTNFSVSIGSGLYKTNTFPNNALTLSGSSVTNKSTTPYPRIVAKPSFYPHQLCGSNFVFTLAVSPHASARWGYPVAAVAAYAMDAAGHVTATNTVSTPTVDWSSYTGASQLGGDPLPVWGYSITLNYGPLNQGSIVSNYFIAYPWWGNVLRSDDGVNPPTSRDYCPRVTWCDKSNAWPVVYALVDTNAPAVGKAVASQLLATNGTAIPFPTIAAAFNAAGLTNNQVNGSNTYANVHVQLTNGQGFAVYGGPNVVSRGGYGPWATIEARPDVNWSNVFLSSKNNSFTIDHGVNLRFSHLNIRESDFATIIDQGHGALCFDTILAETNSQNGASITGSNTNVYLWHCTFLRWRDPGFRPSGNQTDSYFEMRGCTFLGFSGDVSTCVLGPHLALGNLISPQGPEQYGFVNDNVAVMDPGLWMNNELRQVDGAVYAMTIGINNSVKVGFGAAGNLIEIVKDGGSVPLDVMFSQSDNELCSNQVYCANTVLGQYHPPFNLGGKTNVTHVDYLDVGNIFGELAFRSDVSDATAGDTNRLGRLYSVDCSQNVSALDKPASETVSIPSTTELGFDGLGYAYFSNSPSVYSFFTNGSVYGAAGNGFGNYHLLSSSPVYQILPGPDGPMIPFDADGNPVYGRGPPGRYSSQSPRRGD